MPDLREMARKTVDAILHSSTTLSIANSQLIGNLSGVVYSFGGESKSSLKVKVMLEIPLNLGLSPRKLDKILAEHGLEIVACIVEELEERARVLLDGVYDDNTHGFRWFRRE